MSLVVEARHRLGDFSLEAAFTSDRGVTALFGRSGSGKTSLVRIIAGLTRPAEGRVLLGDEVLVDTARRVFVPAHRRRFGYVFQEARLFPHLTVRQNLNYGRWFSQKGARTENPDRVVDLLGIAGLLDRQPANLSGGEKQRVAIGRALLASPRLLLMDEPLSALDKNLREHMQIELKRLHRQLGMTTIYVTHDQQEALTMSDRIAVLDKGRIIQLDVPATVYDRPNCKFVAGFMGETRFLPVERRDQTYVLDGRPLRLADTRAASSTGEAWLMVRPERLRWQGDADHDNRIEGRVLDVVYRGDCNQVSVSLPGGHEVAIRHAGAERQPLPQPGDTLALWLPAEASLVIGSAAP